MYKHVSLLETRVSPSYHGAVFPLSLPFRNHGVARELQLLFAFLKGNRYDEKLAVSTKAEHFYGS